MIGRSLPSSTRGGGVALRALVAALIAMVLAATYLKVAVDHRGGDRSRLFLAGTMFSKPGANEANAYVREGPGYDGQFVLRIAIDPLTKAKTDHGITLDKPPYRHQRIVLPVIAHLLSGGNDRRLTWIVPALNVFFFGVLSALGVFAAARNGYSSALGAVLFAGWPGFATTLVRNLTELSAAVFFVGGLLMLTRTLFSRRAALASFALLSTAVLSREVLLLPLGVIGLAHMVRHVRQRSKVPVASTLHTDSKWRRNAIAGTGLVAIAWQAALWVNWGQSTFSSTGGRDIGSPLSAPIRAIGKLSWSDPGNRGQSLTACALAVMVVAVFSIGFRRQGDSSKRRNLEDTPRDMETGDLGTTGDAAWISTPLLLAFGLTLAFLLSLSDLVWVEDFAWSRVSVDLILCGSFFLITRPKNRVVSCAITIVALAMVTATAFAAFARMISVV